MPCQTVKVRIKFIVEAEGESAGSELSQFNCSAGDDVEGGKGDSGRKPSGQQPEATKGGHRRLNPGSRCKLRSFGGSTSAGWDRLLTFAYFKTKVPGGIEGLRGCR